jgi:hypothetical protein
VCFDILPAVAGYMLDAIAVVNLRLEDLNFLFRDGCATNSPNEFFGFPTEHTPTNDFDAACVMFHLFLCLFEKRKAGHG